MKHLKILLYIAMVYTGGYIHVRAVLLLQAPLATGSYLGDIPLLVLWHDALYWGIAFLTSGIVIGLLVGWVPSRRGWVWSGVVSCLALLLLILTHRYTISRSIFLSVNGTPIGRGGLPPVLWRYIAHLINAAAGGLLGGLIVQVVRRKTERTNSAKEHPAPRETRP